MDTSSSQEVQIKFVDEIFRTESRNNNNGDTPDMDGKTVILS